MSIIILKPEVYFLFYFDISSYTVLRRRDDP